jgi:hypothetical protein
MNIKEQLLKEHSKSNTQKIANYIGDDTERFKALASLFLNSEDRIAQRASWVVSYCGEKFPKLIYPYIGQMIKNLDKKNIHDAVKRNTLRTFQFFDIPKKFQGRLYNMCFSLLTSRKQPIAIKVFSMTLLFNICKKEPELRNELISVIKGEMEYESAGYKARARKILSQLN